MAKLPPPALTEPHPVSLALIERRIYVIRGQKVMLDSDLASLYQVTTGNLNLSVRRNRNRFPEDFMFQLTKQEADSLRLQFATSNPRRGGRRYLPYAFTEHGVAMLSSVLNSDRAVQMNILIIRAFVKLREVLESNKALARKIEEIESTQRQHTTIIYSVVSEIKKLKQPRRRKTRPIGFQPPSS